MVKLEQHNRRRYVDLNGYYRSKLYNYISKGGIMADNKVDEFEVAGAPSWVGDDHDRIIIDIKIEGSISPYVTSADDPDERGRQLFADCIDGKHGEFVERVKKTVKQAMKEEYTADSDACKAKMCAVCDAILKSERLNAGFDFNGKRIQTDEAARNNAAGYLNTLVAGITEILPIVWRTDENEYLSFASLEEYKPFAMAFVTFVKDAYASIFLVKDAIRAATNFEDAWSKYCSYKNVK